MPTGPYAAWMGTSAAPDPATHADVLALCTELTDAFRDLDEARAEDVLDQCFAAMPLEDALRDVVVPLMHGVGDDWATGAFSVAQEHFATAVTSTVLASIAARLPRRGARAGRALVSGTPGERHALGARMVSDFLASAGWDVALAEAPADAAEIRTRATESRASLVALSTSLPWLLPEARAVCVALKALDPAPRVVVGGRAYKGDPKLGAMVGADAFAPDPMALLDDLAVAG